MLLIYRIREFSFQKNNYALVLLTQLIKLMVDVTHTIYMSVLVVVLLKETLITVVSYCYSSTFLLCWCNGNHISQSTQVDCFMQFNPYCIKLSVMMLGTPIITLVQIFSFQHLKTNEMSLVFVLNFGPIAHLVLLHPTSMCCWLLFCNCSNYSPPAPFLCLIFICSSN